ncbi:MAG TPA: MFS transporter [Actinophytocola sp.]|uniref:MFS transporter n=1 Tax=Actinophytocola sp. TaxID=1872138 RepID=UPI002DBD6653|nr:MFS transporter [Actinophytocola sp.]HEU5470126.1 MFS transporter [Actinophytocola sp.]
MTTAVDVNPLWSTRYRATTLGLVLLITIVAFENLGVGTAMPKMMAELHGEDLYSWPFTAFLAANLMATVLAGRVCDRFGPVPALVGGPTVFVAGLLLAGSATGMPVLLAGRVLQGLGGGAQIVGVYVLVALVYPERARARVFGLIATAWVVPALVGPTAAGLITERLGWRWVFLGLAPFALLAMLLMTPALRGLPTLDESAAPATPRRGVPLAAVATGLGLTALTWAAQHPGAGTLWLGLAGVAVLIPALRVLLPRGTLTARPGLPVTILSRGLLAGAFFGAEAYLPLTLVSVHGYSLAMAGLPLTISALGWASASHWQGRHPDLSRPVLIRTGFLALCLALAAITLVAPSWGPAWLSYPVWLVAGAAMGLAFPSISVLTLEYALPRDRGFAASALQVSDNVFAAVMVGFGGVLLTTMASAAAPTAAVIPADLLLAGVALIGAVLYRPARTTRPA